MKSILAVIVAMIFVPPYAQASINVALNKPVTLVTSGASFYNVNPDAGYNPAPGSSVTDGLYRPTGVDWKDGTVFWADSYAGEHYVEIALGGMFEISGFKVQLNENDYYSLYYMGAGGNWMPAWTIGQVLSCCMQVRQTTLANPIITSALKLEGFFEDGTNPFGSTIGYSSDNLFSVAEVEAYGVQSQVNPMPEPTSVALIGLGLLGLAALRYRRFQ